MGIARASRSRRSPRGRPSSAMYDRLSIITWPCAARQVMRSMKLEPGRASWTSAGPRARPAVPARAARPNRRRSLRTVGWSAVLGPQQSQHAARVRRLRRRIGWLVEALTLNVSWNR